MGTKTVTRGGREVIHREKRKEVEVGIGREGEDEQEKVVVWDKKRNVEEKGRKRECQGKGPRRGEREKVVPSGGGGLNNV
jgi:hypothetical protein